MKKITISLLLILLFMFIGLNATGTLKNIFTEVVLPNGISHPLPGSLDFTAYIQSRPNEILAEYSAGCDYNSTYAGHITVQCGNFNTPWEAGETYIVEVYWNDLGPFSNSLILDNESYQFAENIILPSNNTEEKEFDRNFLRVKNNPVVTNNATIKYAIKDKMPSTPVEIDIFNIKGRMVENLIATDGVVSFSVSKLSAGVYLYQIKSDNFKKIKKMVIIK